MTSERMAFRTGPLFCMPSFFTIVGYWSATTQDLLHLSRASLFCLRGEPRPFVVAAHDQTSQYCTVLYCTGPAPAHLTSPARPHRTHHAGGILGMTSWDIWMRSTDIASSSTQRGWEAKQ